MEPDLEAKRLTLDRTAVSATETLRADREMLRQALFNLVQNAVQSSPEGETVEIAVGRGQDGHKRIEVADAGPGVTPEAVDSLFTPYFTTRSNGTGLGLAIVRRIATAHDWQAGYAPRPGGGELEVTAARNQRRLLIEVSDDGPGFQPDAVVAGHGLDNLDARLTALYQGGGKLSIERRNGRTVVGIQAPQPAGAEARV